MRFPFKKKQAVELAQAGTIINGEMKMFAVGDKKIAVARVGDDYYAFDDTCTHMQCPLSKGFLRDLAVVCPCHVSEFDISSGKVLKGPATKPVASYDVQIEAGSIRVLA